MRKMLASRSTGKRIVIGVLLAVIGSLIAWQHAPKLPDGRVHLGITPPGTYAINHFIDGDTISVTMNGSAQPVRFIGVDTPETHKPNTPIQCYGELAAAFTKQTIGNRPVRLIADSLSENRDRYNRLLRYVYLPDGRDLDELLVQQGFGFAYVQFPFTKSTTFTNDQLAAQQNRRGLWGACHPYQESSGRWQTETANDTS